MKRVKIFLASSGTLRDERTEIEKLIARLNDDFVDQKIYLELVIWEKYSGKFSNTRKQEDFNNLARESDVFICLVHDKIGSFSQEEFDAAYDGFRSNKQPELFYLYFSDQPIQTSEITANFMTVLQLKERVQNDQQFYNTYSSTEDLLSQIKDDLRDDLNSLSKLSPKQNMLEILEKSNRGITKYLEDNKTVSVELTGVEYNELQQISAQLEEGEIATFASKHSMMQNREDGQMRTGWVLTKGKNF